MALSDDLRLVAETVPEMGAFRERLASQWLEDALGATEKATLRKRRLPATQVAWLVIGMAMYRNRSIEDVAASLDIALPGIRGVTAASSAVAQARARLGDKPMEYLFDVSADAWAHREAAKRSWRGLKLFAMDGTTFRLQDTPENRKEFPGKTGPAGEMSHPIARMVALLAVDARLLLAARIGPFQTGEQTLAEELWNEVPADSLLIVDRLFNDGSKLAGLASDKNRHWLIRGKKTTAFEVVESLGKGDQLVRIRLSQRAREKAKHLPPEYMARMLTYRRGKKKQTLFTSLLDSTAFPAHDVVDVYHSRWEIENAYDEVKTEMLEREETLRSKKADGVRQEIWGLLIAYNLIRLEMTAIADEADVNPSRVSFITSLNHIRNEFLWCSVASPGAIPAHLQRLREDLKRYVLPERRDRSYPRVVKSRGLKYKRKNVTPALK